MNITDFALNHSNQNLSVTFDDESKLTLSYEYLRVFAPTESENSIKKNNNLIPQVFHKKNIRIKTIESVAKHGYRLVFNDGFSDIFTSENFLKLAESFDKNWGLYLVHTNKTSQSREQTIDITQL